MRGEDERYDACEAHMKMARDGKLDQFLAACETKRVAGISAAEKRRGG
jgi:hypothetical protein